MKKILGVLILTLMLVGTCATPALADGSEPLPCPPNSPYCRPPIDPAQAP